MKFVATRYNRAAAGAHGVLNGSINAINGGNFLDGFAVGAVSSLVGSGLQAAGVGRTLGILSCGLAGAGTAAILGSDPIQGAFQGLAIGALNHFVVQPNGTKVWEGPEFTCTAKMPLGMKIRNAMSFGFGIYKSVKPYTDVAFQSVNLVFSKSKIPYVQNILDLGSDSYQFNNGIITEKRLIYRNSGSALTILVPEAIPAVAAGEFMYDWMYSLRSMIENTYTTQNFINCYPYY